MSFAKNTILYGPPGTGKTYNTILYAVAIIENKTIDTLRDEQYETVLSRYNGYKEAGLIEFVTFHQSYGYEDFIEGIKPAVDDNDDENYEKGDVHYSIEDGLFKSFCNKATIINPNNDPGITFNKAPKIWKISLGNKDQEIRNDCLNNGRIRLGYDGSEDDADKRAINAFINKMRIGDIVFSCKSQTQIDAIGVITGEYTTDEGVGEKGYKRIRTTNWLVKNIDIDIFELNGSKNMTQLAVYELSRINLQDAMQLIRDKNNVNIGANNNAQNHVFIIDEINRGNISKIFGELITLIEPSRRIGQPEETKVRLPYSSQLFGVPDNVYIIGTMNTADRSIATIDTALRRRFQFVEMMPDSSKLDGVNITDNAANGISINIRTLLDTMNKRITSLYDREHTIGHAYFMSLCVEENRNIDKLGEIFKNSVIPLLQEYFYDDYEKIRLVLGDNQKENNIPQFINKTENDNNDLFGQNLDMDMSYTYSINEEAFLNYTSYTYLGLEQNDNERNNPDN